MKTYVITGATGFIGGHLAEDLVARGHRVIALVRDGEAPEGCEVVRGELEDFKACERLVNEHQPDAVFHLAAQAKVEIAKRDPHSTMEANVRGTYNMLEAFRRYRKLGSRFVMASSDKAYGELPEGADAYTEDMPLMGRGPYDVSKTAADMIAQSYATEYHLNMAIIRAGNVYGPGDRDLSRIVPSMVADICNMRPIEIRSDGSPIRDYIYVDDVVRGYVAAANSNSVWPQAYNLASRTPLSVLELAEELLRVVRENSVKTWFGGFRYYSHLEQYLSRGNVGPLIKGTRVGEIQKQVLDPSKAEQDLQWKASTPLSHGLLKTLEWAFANDFDQR